MTSGLVNAMTQSLHTFVKPFWRGFGSVSRVKIRNTESWPIVKSSSRNPQLVSVRHVNVGAQTNASTVSICCRTLYRTCLCRQSCRVGRRSSFQGTAFRYTQEASAFESDEPCNRSDSFHFLHNTSNGIVQGQVHETRAAASRLNPGPCFLAHNQPESFYSTQQPHALQARVSKTTNITKAAVMLQFLVGLRRIHA